MKTKIKRHSRSVISVILAVCMLVSCMTVGIIATNAAYLNGKPNGTAAANAADAGTAGAKADTASVGAKAPEAVGANADAGTAGAKADTASVGAKAPEAVGASLTFMY